MATYCFEEGRQELFIEAGVRGWITGILDFPRLKSEEECIAASEALPDELSPEVCCIPPGDDSAYCQLVTSAWCSFYLCVGSLTTEREITKLKARLKSLTRSEAMRVVRFATTDKGKQLFQDAYHRFQEALAT